jgi:hypothetical protein
MRFTHLLSVFVLFSLSGIAQTVNPATQINWPAVTASGAPSISCSSSNYGQPYTDTTNIVDYKCTPSGWTKTPGALPLAGGTLTGNTNLPYINGIPLADQLAGTDFCSKLNAAMVYALGHNSVVVDATHFSGVQTCGSNPFAGLASLYSNINLTVLLPSAHIETTVAWSIPYSGIHLKGFGPFSTQIEYTGTTVASCIICIIGTYNSSTEFVTGMSLEGLFIYGDNANANDAVYFNTVHHSELRDVYTWGVTTNGIHTAFAVTDTFYRDRTSANDAITIGIYNSGHSAPAHEFYFDAAASGYQTTDGTVTDAAAEGLTGAGWVLASANSMTFTSGTSEGNKIGISVLSPSSYNTFISPDIEQNSANTAGVDVNDAGASNHFINLIATSACSSCSSVVQSGIWGEVVDGYQLTLVNGGNWKRFGNTFENMIAFGWNANGFANLPSSGVSNINTVGLAWNATAGSTEADIWNAYIGGDTIHFLKNTAAGYQDNGSIDGAGNLRLAGQASMVGISTTKIVNNTGLQLTSGPGCSITAGAIGNSCTSANIFFPDGYSDANAVPVCSLIGGNGINVLGEITAIGDYSFIISEVAMSTTSTGGGTIKCIVSHD